MKKSREDHEKERKIELNVYVLCCTHSYDESKYKIRLNLTHVLCRVALKAKKKNASFLEEY